MEKETNSLAFKVSKRARVLGCSCIITANVELNDDCKKGYEYFAVTGEAVDAKTGAFVVGGVIHEEILKVFPDLDMFEKLHLCDYNGVPMHAVANLSYGVREGNWKIVASILYCCSAAEVGEVMTLKDKTQIAAWLVSKRIPERWKSYAASAIEILEERDPRGLKFKSKAVERHYGFEDALDKYNRLVAEGYYTEEAVKTRATNDVESWVNEKLSYFSKKKAELTEEKKIKTAFYRVLRRTFGDNVDILKRIAEDTIYYKHSHELRFNWLYGRVSTDEIRAFRRNAKKSKVLREINITDKKDKK